MDNPSSSRPADIIDLTGEALHAGAYAIQGRIHGAAQTLNSFWGTKLSAQWLSAPTHADFGSARWHAQMIGEGLGGAVPYFGAYFGAQRLFSGVAGRTMGEATKLRAATAMDTLPGSFAAGFATGFVYDGLTAPSATPEKLWSDRWDAARIGGLTFGVASMPFLRDAGRWVGVRSPELGAAMRHPLAWSTASGIIAGGVNAEATALIRNDQHASWSEIGKGAYTFGFTGLGLGALNHAVSPRVLDRPVESLETFRDGTAAQRATEGKQIRRELNYYGDTPAAVMRQVILDPKTRILAIGETHAPNSSVRETLREVLPQVAGRKNVILAEEVVSLLQPQVDHYMRTGKFDHKSATPEQLAALPNLENVPDLIRNMDAARQAGVRVVAIDKRGKDLTPEQRDRAQAEALSELARANPDSTILWTGGGAHTTASRPGTSALDLLRGTLATENTPPQSVVSFYGMNNRGRAYNLSPVLRSLNDSVAVPMRPNGPLANLGFSEIHFPRERMNVTDYLAMYPRKQQVDYTKLLDDLTTMARNDEVGGQLAFARTELYYARDVASFSNVPGDKVIINADLARVERRLGNNQRADEFLAEALRLDKEDILPTGETLLKLMADPKYGTPTKRAEPEPEPVTPLVKQEKAPETATVSETTFMGLTDAQLKAYIDGRERQVFNYYLMPHRYSVPTTDLRRLYFQR